MPLLEIVMTITPWFKQSLGHGFALLLPPPRKGGKGVRRREEEEATSKPHIPIRIT